MNNGNRRECSGLRKDGLVVSSKASVEGIVTDDFAPVASIGIVDLRKEGLSDVRRKNEERKGSRTTRTL